MRTRPAVLTATPLAAALLLAGCASTASTPSSTSTGPAPATVSGRGVGSGPSGGAATTSTAPTSGAPVAVATESNPPGDIPDNQAFVLYTPAAGTFTAKVPEGWAKTTEKTGVLFSDKYNSVQIVAAPAAMAPTVASVTSTDIPALQASQQGFSSPHVTTATRNAGQAILLTYQADSPTNPVTGKVALEAVERYTFWKKGTAVVLTLSAPVGSDNVDPWRVVTDSLTWSS